MLSLPPAAEAALLAAEEALRASDETALERSEDADSAMELTAMPAESVAFAAEPVSSPLPEGEPVGEPLPPEKMVVLPTVLVIVLPSVVMVVRTSDVAIGTPCQTTRSAHSARKTKGQNRALSLPLRLHPLIRHLLQLQFPRHPKPRQKRQLCRGLGQKLFRSELAMDEINADRRDLHRPGWSPQY